MLHSCVEKALQETDPDNSGQLSERIGTIKVDSRELKGMIRGPKIELDQLLSDPSIRDSLRSDGYYKRHQ